MPCFALKFQEGVVILGAVHVVNVVTVSNKTRTNVAQF